MEIEFNLAGHSRRATSKSKAARPQLGLPCRPFYNWRASTTVTVLPPFHIHPTTLAIKEILGTSLVHHSHKHHHQLASTTSLTIGATPRLPTIMFFVKQLEHRIDLHPSYLGGQALDYVMTRLYEEVEGQNMGIMMIISIIDIADISEPKIVPGTGEAQYDISYRAIIFRPFRGEVVDGLVSSVVSNGFFVDVAGLSVFVSKAVSSGQEQELERNWRP